MAIEKEDNWLEVIRNNVQTEEFTDYTQKYELLKKHIPQSSRCNNISIHGLYFGSIRIICFDLHTNGRVMIYRENGDRAMYTDSMDKLKEYLEKIQKTFQELSNGIHGIL